MYPFQIVRWCTTRGREDVAGHLIPVPRQNHGRHWRSTIPQHCHGILREWFVYECIFLGLLFKQLQKISAPYVFFVCQKIRRNSKLDSQIVSGLFPVINRKPVTWMSEFGFQVWILGGIMHSGSPDVQMICQISISDKVILNVCEKIEFTGLL